MSHPPAPGLTPFLDFCGLIDTFMVYPLSSQKRGANVSVISAVITLYYRVREGNATK